ncbi:hypothetical protein ACFL6X_09660 [Candidatus Latescibacterota bacterium]
MQLVRQAPRLGDEPLDGCHQCLDVTLDIEVAVQVALGDVELSGPEHHLAQGAGVLEDQSDRRLFHSPGGPLPQTDGEVPVGTTCEELVEQGKGEGNRGILGRRSSRLRGRVGHGHLLHIGQRPPGMAARGSPGVLVVWCVLI